MKEGIISDGKESYRQSKGFYRYDSLQDIENRLNRGLPISGFAFREGLGPSDVVWVAFGHQHNTMHCTPIQFTTSQSVEFCGITYAKCDGKVISQHPNVVKENIGSNCVIFPHISGQSRPRQWIFDMKFALIFDDWDVMTSTGSKGIPVASSQLLNEDVYDM